MRTVKALLLLVTAVVAASAVVAQTTGRVTQPVETGLVQIDEELGVLKSILSHLRDDSSKLESALAQETNVVWMAADGSGWRAVGRAELIDKIDYLRLAEGRADAKRTDLAALALPGDLVELVRSRPNRPAGRVLREWVETRAAATDQAVAGYRQSLSRNMRMVEGWIAENEARRAEMTAPVSQAVLSQGGCYVPAGSWQVADTREVLEVTHVGRTVLATKTKGSVNIPAGKLSFYLNSSTCDGGLQQADEGFENRQWLRGKVEVRWAGDDQFSVVWPDGRPVTYTRVK